jgi:hypothetical protein
MSFTISSGTQYSNKLTLTIFTDEVDHSLTQVEKQISKDLNLDVYILLIKGK